MSDLVIAAVQMTSGEDVEANLERARELVCEAATAGALLVGLPENFAYLGSRHDHKLAIAEELPAVGRDRPAGRADRTDLDRDACGRAQGGHLAAARWFPRRRATSAERINNTAVLINPEGTISAIYRKMHLFDVDVPGGKRFRESDTVEPGAEVVVAPTPWGGLGLSICYDLRFPELYRAHAAQGARIIAVPSAFTLETGKDHWHVLLRARAIENQVYVMAPAQFGTHGATRRSYGHALVVDPWGVIVAECGDQEGFALARLDFAYQDKVRAALPCLTHRRL